ncbi:MAG TPA: hypothetical protein VJY83_00330 [Thiopseudomonas sp.]|nr:hypothetical protein [Thiopseudomonas sp.]
MSSLTLLKLKDNLTIYEAGAYLGWVMGLENKLCYQRIAQVSGLVNEGKLNLYLNPNGFQEGTKRWVEYDSELEGNDCELKGEQKFISVFLNNSQPTNMNAGAQIIGDVFAGSNISFFTCAENDAECIARAVALENTFLTNRISTITSSLCQREGRGDAFLYIKRKEIDALVAALKVNEPIQSGQPKKTTSEYRYETQQRLIIEKLKALGYVPTELPKRQQGKPWVKSDVRKALDGIEPFKAKSSFDETWKRLSRDKDIKEKS